MTLQHQSEAPRQWSDEHARLRDLFESIRVALDTKAENCDTVASLVEELAQNVLDHFEHEEHDGYFAEVLETAPRLSSRVNTLLSQHLEMRAQLVALRECAEDCDGSDRRSRELSDQFHHFFECFCAHETAENTLLQEAYSVDIGAED